MSDESKEPKKTSTLSFLPDHEPKEKATEEASQQKNAGKVLGFSVDSQDYKNSMSSSLLNNEDLLEMYNKFMALSFGLDDGKDPRDTMKAALFLCAQLCGVIAIKADESVDAAMQAPLDAIADLAVIHQELRDIVQNSSINAFDKKKILEKLDEADSITGSFLDDEDDEEPDDAA